MPATALDGGPAGPFDRSIGIDWSGAKGPRLPGLAVASVTAAGLGLHQPAGGWSRLEIVDWLLNQPGRSLVGIDCAFSLPFADRGAFLPHSDLEEAVAPGLWRAVEKHCETAADLHAGPFVDHYRDWFRTSKDGAGVHFAPRYRVTEVAYNSAYGGRCEHVFHLVGPSQVGLSALSVMRMLARLDALPDVAIWPMHDMARVAAARLVLVELFATQFVRLAGIRGKIRDSDTLSAALATFGLTLPKDSVISDHVADASLMAAGLAKMARHASLWQPAGLTDALAQTEGWIFGVEQA